jgi:hypothetical protein
MLSRFRLELDVAIDTDSVPTVIATARQCYAAERGADTVERDGSVRPIPADEFIDVIEQALLELIERNPLLDSANIEVERVTCGPAPASSQPGVDTEVESESEIRSSGNPEDVTEGDDETEDDLEEFETGLYLCRWPNGEFSLVKADDRRDAVLQLDEWAGAEPAWLVPIETCMVDFRLNACGEIELAEFGEETAEFVWEKCYPKLDEVLSSEDVLKHLSGNRSPEAAKKIRRAVEHERKRLWNAEGKPTPAKTILGRELQKRLRTVGPVADHYIEIAANEILRAKDGNGKPN